ncbi:MAG TPA: 16S rRNA (cytidine(1402)-2'-O)-methyltransferase [Candidatus Moranbacteria bacterium]|nr:16S rRNA (cytidine(1402)-2'-O)-methyltransferase [Candidatus Moranbacteria bacterium]
MNSGILYIVATPIGNLEDITFRAVKALEKADLIFCEDTRVTKKLLDHYKIVAETRSFYGHGSKSRKPEPNFEYIISELKAGKNVAFVTDAGTPGISDPGNRLVAKAIENGIAVFPVSGASALTTLASISGIDLAKFMFLGFPPHKKGRETFFKEVAGFKYPVIYYESPHRLIKNLELLRSLSSEKNIILGRELTKMFEEVVRGTVSEVLDYFKDNEEKVRGEIAVIVY